MDYDADGTLDFISGCYDPGDIYLFRRLGEGRYAAAERLYDRGDVALVHHPEELAKASGSPEAAEIQEQLQAISRERSGFLAEDPNKRTSSFVWLVLRKPAAASQE